MAGEFSDIEKDDFLQHLLDVYAPGQLAISPRLAPLPGKERLPTLFDCRMDLFKEWVSSWEDSEREELLSRFKEADPDFMERFEKSKSTPNEEKVINEFWITNGHAVVSNGETNQCVQNGTARHENGNEDEVESAIEENSKEESNHDNDVVEEVREQIEDVVIEAVQAVPN